MNFHVRNANERPRKLPGRRRHPSTPLGRTRPSVEDGQRVRDITLCPVIITVQSNYESDQGTDADGLVLRRYLMHYVFPHAYIAVP